MRRGNQGGGRGNMIIVVDKDKILSYLLKYKNRNDKSKFLNKLGFYESNWQTLQNEITNIFIENEAVQVEENQYGFVYEVSGVLKGYYGLDLNVKTIWINLYSSNEIRFVTLFPERL